MAPSLQYATRLHCKESVVGFLYTQAVLCVSKCASRTLLVTTLLCKLKSSKTSMLSMINTQRNIVICWVLYLLVSFVNCKAGTRLHNSLKNLYWKCFWCCTPLQTLSAVCRSPSNSKQRQGPFQVSRGADGPAVPLILTGKIAEWALLAFVFHLLWTPSPKALWNSQIFICPQHRAPSAPSTPPFHNLPWQSCSLKHYSVWLKFGILFWCIVTGVSREDI